MENYDQPLFNQNFILGSFIKPGKTTFFIRCAQAGISVDNICVENFSEGKGKSSG